LGLLGVWVTLTTHHLVDKLYVNNIYIQLGALFGLLQLLDERYFTILQKRKSSLDIIGINIMSKDDPQIAQISTD